MTDAQVAELEQTVTTSVTSTTIEWSLNFRVCDLLQANPALTPTFMRLVTSKLKKDSAVPVLLALSLLEIVAKNCGTDALAFVDGEVVDALLALVKKREGWKYSVGRNMFKTFGSSTLVPSIDEGQRELWLQASLKVREMLQLWADAFLLQEGRLRPIFEAYKKLRSEGYTFPEKKQGASAEICLMKGAEESPAYLAAGGSMSSAASPASEDRAGASPGGGGSSPVAAVTPQDLPARPSTPPLPAATRINLTPAAVDATRDMCRELKELATDPSGNETRLAELYLKATAARDEAMRQIRRQMENPTSEMHLESLMLLLDDLNAVLPSQEPAPRSPPAPASPAPTQEASDLIGLEFPEGGGAAAAAAVADGDEAPLPPPPSEAPPDLEQQMLYDEILARYLQDRENAAFANEEEDAALALRLSLEFDNEMPGGGGGALSMVSCAQCRALNQLAAGGSGHFICYACGLTQGVPGRSQPRSGRGHMQGDGRPTRHAPPPRVINTGGASELLIGSGGPAAAEPDKTGGYVPPTIATSLGTIPAHSFEGGMGSQALLGSAPKSSKAWKMSVPSMPSFANGAGSSSSNSGYSSVANLGDGAPASEYTAMGEEGGYLCADDGPSPPKSSNSMSSGLVRSLMPWRKKKDGDQKEGLLERVQVDDQWELIQPRDQRPYWHNSQTQASQWQPPDVVSSSTGLLNG